MCDFSLQSVRSRDAVIEDKLVVKDFGTGTRGFATADDLDCAVCVKPGTEIAFDAPINWHIYSPMCEARGEKNFNTAIFRQVNKDKLAAHHDALELPDGTEILLTLLNPGQTAKVLQLPAAPKTAEEVAEQRRVEFVG